MFAFTYTRYGSPDVIAKTQMPKPTPKPGEVLIKTHATTVSSGDWRARSLTMPKGLAFAGRLVFGITGPRKPVLGTEFAGTVESAGAGVTTFASGDAVIGFPGAGFGAHAEYIVMPADGKIAHKPDHISFATAAAVPFGGTTAYDFLINKAKIKSGESVLINGASGATGSACVQIAAHLGATVTAVCSGKNADLVHGLGASHVIDYNLQDFATGEQQYDVVVDTVATAPLVRTRHALRAGGRMVMIAGNTSDMIFGGLKARLRGLRMIGGVASESRDILQAVVNLTSDGDFKPVIDRCYAFDDMRAAHQHVDTGHKKGSVVVTIIPEEQDR